MLGEGGPQAEGAAGGDHVLVGRSPQRGRSLGGRETQTQTSKL